MDQAKAEELLAGLREMVLPSEADVVALIDLATGILQLEPNVIYLAQDAVVVGDLHGQYYDFLTIEETLAQAKAVVFLGDYVDRGYNSVELMLHILLYKILRRESVILLRGNHENRAQTNVYGFRSECEAKYNRYVYWKFCDMFLYMPFAAVVNQYYFCVHGGIVPGLTL